MAVKLNGWVRIGIVLSTLWVVAVAGRLAYEIAIDPASVFMLDATHDYGWQFQGERRGVKIDSLVTIGKFLVVSVVPIVVVWLVAWLAVIAFRWIHAGFKAQSAHLAASRVGAIDATEEHSKGAVGAEATSFHAGRADSWKPPIADRQARPLGWRTLLRWSIRAFAILLALVVNGVFLSAAKQLGLGALVAGLVGGLICWFIVWVWTTSSRL